MTDDAWFLAIEIRNRGHVVIEVSGLPYTVSQYGGGYRITPPRGHGRAIERTWAQEVLDFLKKKERESSE